jgi:HEAT repeat protein
MKKIVTAFIMTTFFSFPVWSKPSAKPLQNKPVDKISSKDKTPAPTQQQILLINQLDANLKSQDKDKKHIDQLKKLALELSNLSVPSLIKAMKDEKYPEHKRWFSTFLLGQIMGEKSAPFIAKFYEHPNPMMRLASLKTLMVLKQDKYVGLYARSLTDSSLIVRQQALDLISNLKIQKVAPSVWNMLYDKSNYSGNDGKLKRSNMIGKIVRTIGDLNFTEAKKPMLTMIKNKKFNDIFNDLDYSLSKIANVTSPQGGVEQKRNYWAKIQLQEKIN